MRRSFVLATGFLGMMLVAGMAFGQRRPVDGSDKPRPVNTFGSTETYYRISYSQFTTEQGVSYNDTGSGLYNIRRYTVGLGELVSALQLPAGAIIDYAELDSCENNASMSTSLDLFDCHFNGSGCMSPPFASVTQVANSGCGYDFVSGVNYGPVDNINREYLVVVTTPAGNGSEALSGVLIGYHIQVSPAPATATFLDVPTTSPIFRFVEALVASGITAGCDATHYCPSASLTRGQMAVYLATALGLSWN